MAMGKSCLVLILFSLLQAAVLAQEADVSVSYAYIELNITNDAPVISSLSFGRHPVFDDSVIVCNATASDRENDIVQFRYAWYVNGQMIDYDRKELPSGNFAALDSVACEAIPYDLNADGLGALTSVVVSKTPPYASFVKAALSYVGSQAKVSEIVGAQNQGLASVTGFAVVELWSSDAGYAGFLLFVGFLLVFININVILRIRKNRQEAL
jgi:hypothetical protein